MNPNGPMTQTQNFVRFAIYAFFLLCGLITVTIALFFNQVKGGTKYIESVKNQSIRSIRIPSKRGRIISSDLKILASNQPSFELVFYLEEMRQPGFLSKTRKHIYKCVQEVSKVLNRPIPLKLEDISIICHGGKSMTVTNMTTTDNKTYNLSTAYYKDGTYELYATLPNGKVINIFNTVILFLIISSFKKISLRPKALIPVKFAV